MNILKQVSIISLVIILLLVVCGTPSTSNTSSVKSFPTQTSIPMTETPILPTQTVTPTSTPTIIPTLSEDDARKRLLDLLANNGNCQLPCIWGIIIGKSNYEEAQNTLMPLSSIAVDAYFEPLNGILGGWITPLYVEGELQLNTSVSYLYGNDGIVSSIYFRTFEEKVVTDPRDPSGKSWLSKTPIYGLPTFIKRIEYYSLSHLLSEQGIPTSVMIASSGPSINRNGSITFHIVVLYPSQGIWAEYTTVTNESDVGSVIRSCPVNAHIEMNLYPPGNPDSFYKLLDKTDWGITKNSYKPLQEATSMSVEKFYETFQNPTDKSIATPTNIWPTPENLGNN